MKERPLEHTEPTAEREKPQRMIKREKGLLSSIAEGPAGKWLAGAALFLSAQGCGAAFREFRREVRTDVVGVPSVDYDTGELSAGGVQATFSGRTAEERVRIAEEEHDRDFARTSDRLVMEDLYEYRGGHRRVELLEPSALTGRWYREMQPGHVYETGDGYRYAVLAFRMVTGRPTPDYSFEIVPEIVIPRREGRLDGSVDPMDLLPERAIRPSVIVGSGEPETLDPGLLRSEEGMDIHEMANHFFHEPASVLQRMEVSIPRHRTATDPVGGLLSRSARAIDAATGSSDDAERIAFYLIRTDEPNPDVPMVAAGPRAE